MNRYNRNPFGNGKWRLKGKGGRYRGMKIIVRRYMLFIGKEKVMEAVTT